MKVYYFHKGCNREVDSMFWNESESYSQIGASAYIDTLVRDFQNFIR